MNKIHFEPWVGENYKNQNKKLFILGESHYAENPDQAASFTIDRMQGISKEEWTHPYWTKILQAITGKKKWEVDLEEFWSKFIFYNYIQEIVGPSCGIAPTKEMCNKAWEPFSEVLCHYQPSHILVVGKRLWNSLPDEGKAGEPIIINDEKFDTWYFPYERGQAISTYINHPAARGFDSKKWHAKIKALMDKS